MRYDTPLTSGVLIVLVAGLAGCSLRYRPVEESVAVHQVNVELAWESADSDAAVILKQALQDAQELAPDKRGDFLAESLDRTRDARAFEIRSEAPLPAGWPRPSLPGLIRIKAYPPVRSAWAKGDNPEDGQFMTLFRHIKSRQVAMTAPVVMEYDSATPSAGSEPDRTGGMAFLYRRVGQGKTGRFGPVAVSDEKPLKVVSVGVKGAYFRYRFRNAFARLYDWMDKHPEWRPSGMPRVLGYNSPFMPFWLKYSEVQIPVVRSALDQGGRDGESGSE